MIASITVRYFSHCYDEEGEPDIVEVTEGQFLALKETRHATIEYERHTIRENGVSQIVLTVHTEDCPDLIDLERFGK